jgi:major outer membrane protein
MKKNIVAFLSILSCVSAYALPVGNPSEATLLSHGAFFNTYCEETDSCYEECCPLFSLRAGFYGDYIFDGHLQLAHSPHRDANYSEIHTNAGYLAINFFDRIDLFTTLGVSWIKLSINNNLMSPETLFPNLETFIVTKADFSWSIGGRATLFEWSGFACGLEGQYFNFSPGNVKYVNPGGAQINTDDVPYHFRYHEWQIGGGISYQLTSFLVPYIALKASRASIDINSVTLVIGGEFITLPDFRSSHYFGGAVGVSLVTCDTIAFTVEGRFFNENALYVNAQVRF